MIPITRSSFFLFLNIKRNSIEKYCFDIVERHDNILEFLPSNVRILDRAKMVFGALADSTNVI